MAFQLSSLANLMAALSQERTTEHDALVQLIARVRGASIDDLKRRDAARRRPQLEAYLQALRAGFMQLAEALTARYLVLTAASRLTASS